MARLPNFLVIIRSEKLSGKGQGRGGRGAKKRTFRFGKKNVSFPKVETFRFADYTFTIAPYARYSFLQSDLIKLFVDGGFGFSTAKVKGSDAANSWNIGLKPGLAIKLSDRFCLVAKYGFLGYSQDETPMGTKTKNFGLDLDTDELSFGFHYIF